MSVADLAEFVRDILTGDGVIYDGMLAELLTPSVMGAPPSIASLGNDIAPGTTAGNFVYSNQGQDGGSRAEFFHFTSAETNLGLASK